MNALHLYIAALVLIGLPTAAFNRVAAGIVGVWALAFLAVGLGMDPRVAGFAQHVAGMAIGVHVARTRYCAVAAFLYVPMIVIDALQMVALVAAYPAWWTIYVLAWVQLGLAVMGADFAAARQVWREYREQRSSDVGSWRVAM